MTHRVHPVQRTKDGSSVPQVRAGVHRTVEHEGLVTVFRRRVDDMGPDEPGTAGDQYSHAGHARAGPGPLRRATPGMSRFRETATGAGSRT